MSRFADPTATERMVLGPCVCPGKPHAEDWLELRTELGAWEVLQIAGGDSLATLEMLVVDWNILDSTGAKPPVERENIRRLYADAFDELDAFIEAHVRVGSLPNGSAAPSRSSSRGSGSRTRGATTAA